mgnify:CR=1 FL=1
MTTPVTAHTPLNAAIRDAGWRRNPTTGHLFDAAGRDLGVKGYEAAWVALWRAGAIAPDAAMRAALDRYVAWLGEDAA